MDEEAYRRLLQRHNAQRAALAKDLDQTRDLQISEQKAAYLRAPPVLRPDGSVGQRISDSKAHEKAVQTVGARGESHKNNLENELSADIKKYPVAQFNKTAPRKLKSQFNGSARIEAGKQSARFNLSNGNSGQENENES